MAALTAWKFGTPCGAGNARVRQEAGLRQAFGLEA
jgi:hypothetical protein